MIRSAWESPTNEGTCFFALGNKQRQIPKTFDPKTGDHAYEWEVGQIIMEPSTIFCDDGFGNRIIVIDTDGERRVSLPAATCAWEWYPEGTEEEDD